MRLAHPKIDVSILSIIKLSVFYYLKKGLRRVSILGIYCVSHQRLLSPAGMIDSIWIW